MNENEFGSYIREIRQKRRILLVTVAKALGVAKSYISAIELGERSLNDPVKLEQLATCLEMTQREAEKMYRIASKQNGRLPADVENYAMNTPKAIAALRKAKKRAVDEAFWDKVIRVLDESDGN